MFHDWIVADPAGKNRCAMLTLHKIDSLDLPELQPYRTMRRHAEHREQGIFVAEGEKVVRRLLASELTVISLLVPEKWARELETLIRARQETVRVFVAEKKLLEQLTGFSMYQGLLAVGTVPKARTLEELITTGSIPRLLVAADGIASAENLGALVRNCGAFGAHALLVSNTSCSPFLRRAVRSSMGVVFDLPVVEGLPLRDALQQVRKHGIRCLAAHPRATARSLYQSDLSCDCCIIFGSEGHGISDEVLNACHDTIAIQMSAGVDSLNVASASAVFLFEASRQRFAR